MDLVGAGEEDQDVARLRHRESFAGERGGLLPDRRLAGRSGATVVGGGPVRTVQDFHGICAASGLERFDRGHVTGELVSLKGCGHDDDPEIRALAFLERQTAGEGNIDGKAALVELIENDCGDAAQLGIVLQDALEDTVR